VKNKSEIITIWVTRDAKEGAEPDLLMLHAAKPEIEDGVWGYESTCVVVPDVKHGKSKRLRLYPQSSVGFP